jgi:hypothetical protein
MRRTGSAAITARADKEKTTISASKNERDMELRLTENTVACVVNFCLCQRGSSQLG